MWSTRLACSMTTTRGRVSLQGSSRMTNHPGPTRLGLFGGSFDPVHLGHLLLADTCCEACSLDRVWFLPCGQPPHKPEGTLTPGKQRAEMLEFAIAGDPRLGVCRLELDRS